MGPCTIPHSRCFPRIVHGCGPEHHPVASHASPGTCGHGQGPRPGNPAVCLCIAWAPRCPPVLLWGIGLPVCVRTAQARWPKGRLCLFRELVHAPIVRQQPVEFLFHVGNLRVYVAGQSFWIPIAAADAKTDVPRIANPQSNRIRRTRRHATLRNGRQSAAPILRIPKA